jgi:UDP-N-acetylglucosamine 2-epimerase
VAHKELQVLKAPMAPKVPQVMMGHKAHRVFMELMAHKEQQGLAHKVPQVTMELRVSKVFTEPMDYFSFQKLIKYCTFVLTDSGGIQEETTFLQKPCITLRPNTERPITVTSGSNTLSALDFAAITKLIEEIENGTYKKGVIPPMWDGKATSRVIETFINN